MAPQRRDAESPVPALPPCAVSCVREAARSSCGVAPLGGSRSLRGLTPVRGEGRPGAGRDPCRWHSQTRQGAGGHRWHPLRLETDPGHSIPAQHPRSRLGGGGGGRARAALRGAAGFGAALGERFAREGSSQLRVMLSPPASPRRVEPGPVSTCLQRLLWFEDTLMRLNRGSERLVCAEHRVGSGRAKAWLNPSRARAWPRVCSLPLEVAFPSPRASGERGTALHRHVKTQPCRSSTRRGAPGFPRGACPAKLTAVLNELMESARRGSSTGGRASCRCAMRELRGAGSRALAHFQAQGAGSPN